MSGFDSFVVFAEMRTGSNFLEANLNMFKGVKCHGEAFNPHFIGYPDNEGILNVSLKDREKDPQSLLAKIKQANGMNGFRYFNDHEPRVLDDIIDDQRCAKIILTRNPIDSFVSWKIAKATGQWKLTNVTHSKTEQIKFSSKAFQSHMADLQAFQVTLLNRLQTSGQTAFYVAYEDLQSVEVMNGLATFLGVEDQLKSLNKKLKKQNPEPMSAKVSNFEEMEWSLAKLDRFNLNRTPNFEPRRGPMIPNFAAAPDTPLLFMPMRTGPNQFIRKWLASIDKKRPSELRDGFTHKELRTWLQSNVGHRAFTVLRHPVARAHTAFCERILTTGEGGFPEIRATLRRVHDVPLPDPEDIGSYNAEKHREAFLAFLRFLKSNLSAQTAVRVDGSWASQSMLLQGMAEFKVPDLVLREDDMRNQLALLASQFGKKQMLRVPEQTDALAGRLEKIYDEDIEAAAQEAYMRDYESFGFGAWKS